MHGIILIIYSIKHLSPAVLCEESIHLSMLIKSNSWHQFG